MSQESPIAVSLRSPSPEIVITRADTPELRTELATRINGAHPDLHNSLWLAQAHAAMIGHFASTFHAPITEVLENFRSDPSIVSNVFNSTIAPAPTASPDPLMIPPMPSPILPNREPITPTSPVPAYVFPPPYPTTPSNHFDVASTPSRPLTPVLEHVLAAIEAEVVAEVIEEVRPQPGVQPGPDWFRNFEDPGYRFFKLIPDPTGQLHIAPFVCVDLTAFSPQLLMTNGRNCPTHSRPLHARPKEVPHAAYDRQQNFLFHNRQLHTPVVDWALEQEDDITLMAEVKRHRRLTDQARDVAMRIAALRNRLHDTQADLIVSSHSLSRANVYRRVRRHIVNRLSPQSSPYSSRHVARMVEAVNSPWNWTDEELATQCEWCKRYGHREEWCTYLRKCMLCGGQGHLDEDCRRPHAFCSPEVECNVPLLHVHRTVMPCSSTIRLDEEL